MGLGIYLALLGIALFTVRLYRSRRAKAAAQTFTDPITAASIHTIEAAFIRAGSAGVQELRNAAALCGRDLRGPTEPAEIERALIERGFAFDADLQRTMTRLRYGVAVAAFAAFVALFVTLRAGTDLTPRDAWLELDIAGFITVVAGVLVTQPGTITERGRRALAIRRAAFPLALLREADPTEAVALYGGRAQRRTDAGRGSTGNDDGTSSTYVWSSDGGHGGHGTHGDSGGHGSSHGCGAASCGSSGCGGH